MADSILVTGFPSMGLARRVVHRLLDETPAVRLCCLVPGAYLADAQRWLGRLGLAQRQRVVLFEGDVPSMDLGLSGRELEALLSEVRVIHHCAAETHLSVRHQQAERTHVRGTSEVLQFAEQATVLDRLVYWSTATVSGALTGRVFEDELRTPPKFHNAVEETRFRAEVLVRRTMPRMPVTILRPSLIVGDSTTGETDRFDGPYLLVLLALRSPPDVRMPAPGRGRYPLHLVPIDYVVRAGLAIAAHERSLGRAFHIVDPSPCTARQVFDLITKAAGRQPPRGFVPANLAAALLGGPLLRRFLGEPLMLLDQLGTDVIYDDRNSREILSDAGLACPPFASYVQALVDYAAQSSHTARTRRFGHQRI